MCGVNETLEVVKSSTQDNDESYRVIAEAYGLAVRGWVI